jgi:hypothetical protein
VGRVRQKQHAGRKHASIEASVAPRNGRDAMSPEHVERLSDSGSIDSAARAGLGADLALVPTDGDERGRWRGQIAAPSVVVARRSLPHRRTV